MANTLKFGNGQWATGNGTALAYNDENSNFKPLPFDFTRASSGTTVNQSGLIETVDSGIPRIDFQGNTKGALLLEPSRSNSITYSENVLLWSTSGTIIREDNVSISPNGKQTASTITSTNVSTFNNIRQNFSVSANSTCTASLFIKKVQTETNYLGLGIVFTGATTDVAYISFDSVNGIARNMDSRITAILNVVDYGTYWRLEATATDSESNTQVEMYVYTTLSTNGTTVSSGASSIRTIWGMQLELNSSYATSYIPTSGSAVTRVADDCSQSNIPTSVINSLYPFSMYVESANIGGNRFALCFINISSTNEYFVIKMSNSEVQFDARANGTTELIQSGITINNGAKFKVAITMESATSGKICVNGNAVVSKTNFASQTANSNIKDLLLGQLRVAGDTGDRLPIYDAKLYNTALTDQELIALTT